MTDSHHRLDHNGEVIRFRNFYRCPCGEEWQDEWSSACDDRCPACDSEIEPHKSEDITPGGEER